MGETNLIEFCKRQFVPLFAAYSPVAVMRETTHYLFLYMCKIRVILPVSETRLLSGGK